tara:strand:+ start:102384 stop:102845 length:462 start_codon:yes stop_codon:yes gene_type:complete
VSVPARRQRLQRLAKLLDNAIELPGSRRFGIGLDGLLGLIPGLGDLAGLALSGYIIIEGVRLGAPLSLVLRMLGNVTIDAVVGLVPVVGDIFDCVWHANQRNVALLDRYLDNPGGESCRSKLMVLAVVLALLGLIAIILYAGIALLKAVLGAF